MIGLAKEQMRCNRCGQESYLEDCHFDCIFPGSLEEPMESETLCPHCKSNDLEPLDEEPLCEY